jgi:DNA-binding NarL/FixJ family response regulator
MLLLDLRMPILSGIEAARTTLRKQPEARIVVFTTDVGDEDIRSVLAVGVKAYLTKDVLYDELLAAIRTPAKPMRAERSRHFATAPVAAS